VICPNCGEKNSENFRYCGMCGTSLEARRPAGAPRTVSSEAPRTFQSEATLHEEAKPHATTQTSATAVREVPRSTGPSFLGLSQSPVDEARNGAGGGGTSTGESFAGLDSFFEPEEPGVSVRGIILLLVLVAILGAGGWWAYAHYNGAKSASTSQTAAEPTPAQPAAPESAANSTTPSQKAPETSAGAGAPAATEPTSNTAAQPASSTPPTAVESKKERQPPAPVKPVENAERDKPKRERKIARVDAKPAPRPSTAAPVLGDKGEAEFKRGEAYLYGHGVSKNCDLAIKDLKSASAKQNAKARSTFGTMYATGHCVARDLPTSYSWFALALRADPSNQILEKDLTAIWNQMTPPERQIAMRSKP